MLRQIPSLQRTAPRLLTLSRPTVLSPSTLSSRSLTTATSSAEATAPTPSPAESPSSPLPTPPRQLSYLVSRTPSNNLSVYNLAKSGGTQKLTTVKKIAGDARALRREMVAELGFPMEEVNINPVTGHINVKGWHQEKIRAWLEARGF
ncbi:putative mitochondrial large ribosomal subunit protein [Phaeoacremonium minimum UCRPA7]|uniref:Large ribosomal subunit protein mL49 n=1 Tax=Phaeoacremonium minimum (strain UCR-PA7) TaxID=1286976 RepID=R8BGI1_PHAM7|nr:putative mitochondrial large ribosomal subunit protein [Phaeoacremonium minimum UCRPA7]EON98433.1 putative mitochondrial large ribosomal subunit protein [Phaeoacremonium minimum UCRPA7]